MRLIPVMLLMLLVGCSPSNDQANAPIVSLHTELGGDASGFERACESRDFSFPQDHGAHPSYRNEWWYITGNVSSDRSVDIGFHATFFRIANSPDQPDRASAWSASQLYMGHFAISVEGHGAVKAHERFARAAAGLSGARLNNNSSTTVWLDDWTLQHAPDGAWKIKLAEGSEQLALTLTEEKPVVLQGQDGYSQKSADPCNASYYYSLPRLSAVGTIKSADQTYQVQGTAWIDREWSSSALASGQVGWDWFALQLDDGRDIMLYQLRKSDGSADPFSHAVEVDSQGNKREIPLPRIEISRWWQSPTGAKYPVAGKLQRTDTDEVIVFTPLIDNQELLLTVRYWEGAIRLTDEAGIPTGRGYLELTGY